MSDKQNTGGFNDGLALEEAKPKLKRPPMYKVVLINDDYTPMEFVVEILITVFCKSENDAVQIMIIVHALNSIRTTNIVCLHCYGLVLIGAIGH